MQSLDAIYAAGVFRPTGEVRLPDQSRVRITFEPIDAAEAERERLESLDAIHEVLDERYSSGETDVAARHNEIEDKSWITGVNQAWAEDWSDPREDIYTINDGESFHGPR